jgi:predicted porin
VRSKNIAFAPRVIHSHRRRVSALARAAALFGGCCGVAYGALADGTRTPDGPLTWNGITVYGTLDVGYQYDTHGTPISDSHQAGFEEIISKNSNGSVHGLDGNNLSQSKFGLRGVEDIGNGWSGVFRLEVFFNPWSGNISDALKSMTNANGVPLASQSTAADSTVAGQFLQTSYLGLNHSEFGTLTFGRQNGVLFDGIVKYDPMGASHAFSPIGFSGTASGGGSTEDRRLDGSLKYDLVSGPVHFGAQFQPKTGANRGTTTEAVVGWNFPGGSLDAYYMQKYDAITSAPLSAAQVTSVGQVCAGTATGAIVAQYACAAIDKALAGTASDNTSYALMGKWAFADGQATLFAGYEHIKFQNPSNSVVRGQIDIGGYVEVFVNNTAFPNPKVQEVAWIGLKYAVTPQLDLTGAYYRYDQNAYSTATPGCSSAALSAQCSGSEDFASFLVVYRFTKRFDFYGGAMWSSVKGGLANGFLNTSMIDPTIGARYSF